MKVLLGVSGSIAAFRAADLIGCLREAGHEVRVVMTDSAARFITPLTLETLSAHPVALELWEPESARQIEHIELARWPDLVLIAPCTANVIGKVANGIADDLLTTILLATPPTTPILLAPAMNTHMWQNPVVQRNVEYLLSLEKYAIIPPRESLLACGDYGEGALAHPEAVAKAVQQHFGGAPALEEDLP